MSNFESAPIIFTYVDKTESEEFFKSFSTQKQIVMYRPKRNRYSEFTGEKMDKESLIMFIDGIISGSGRFTKLDSYPSFEYINEDL